jgi:hypothetical protein
LRILPIKIVGKIAGKIAGLCCDLAGQEWLIIISEFFSMENEAPAGIKFRIAKSRRCNGSSRFVRRIGENTVMPTKIILVLLLLTSAITAAFANPPGGSYIQCDPKNPRSPVRCTPDGW